MMGSNLMDEIDCGSFFDHIDDLIEFPPDNDTGLGSCSCKNLPSIRTNTAEDLLGSDPIFSGRNRNDASDLSAELAVPDEDIVQLEWLSTFVEDSFSGRGMTLTKEIIPVNNVEFRNQFQISSPVSVLDSSSNSSCSEGKTILLSPTHCGPQRAHSKRLFPATFNPRSAMQLIFPTSSATDNPQLFVPILSSESENFTESHPMKIPKPAAGNKKKKKLTLSFPLDSMEMNHNPSSQGAVRKCMHCEITKTPQWRAGPMGPKTLCNACGVRYKSGRLFPEHRPAASPTFLPLVHSNSHKKVIEMRIKGSEKKIMAGAVLPTTPEPELIPNRNALLNYM